MTNRISIAASFFSKRQCLRRHASILRLGVLVFAAILLLGHPAPVQDGVALGLQMCVRSVIPSLFPFLVLSPMLADGIRQTVFFLCRKRAQPRYASLAAALLVGMTAGFPIGALTLLAFYRDGRISREDAERFLGVCTGASPAFLIGYFGQALWGSAALGWITWGVQCLICLIGWLLLMRRAEPSEDTVGTVRGSDCPTMASCLSDAVFRMMQICGSVVFFSVLRSFLCHRLGGAAAGITGGLAEMTGGLRDLCALYEVGLLNCHAALICSMLLIGFGGVCVGIQVSAAASGAGISMRRYWCHRVWIGAAFVSAALCAVCIAD